ncbi:tol-pal system protein YbgF [Legionella oakridgensis]|nr:tol-pal system protein YbgF [Legionella oakridgensis]ETO92264.1 tol-pal system protein YbgF [Legionella oakridgensis RV-2-2007]KTD39624.1 outer membrane protein [Legionella oakridgensis]STY21140.1 outer membrane protein [Legionella longbeachae]
MIKSHRLILAACFSCMLPFGAFSEVPIVDDSENFALLEDQQEVLEQPIARQQADFPENDEESPLAYDEPEAASNTASNRDNAALLDKIQNLQQEVQELRGQLEVQAHDLKLLQEQQLAFYKDLDSRLHNNSPVQTAKKDITIDKPEPVKKTTSINNPTPVPDRVPASVSGNAIHANPADEQISYLAAYELIKNKKYDEATNAMQTYISQYPQSGYAANAQYWLGELYMLKKDYPKAIEHFEAVLQQFPSSSKSAASLLKIGYALAASGKNNEAKQRLQQVIKNYPDTNTAQLATTKLRSLDI